MKLTTWLGVALSLCSSLAFAADVTLNQSSSDAITPLNSVSCNGGGFHTDNRYFRVFDLAPLNLGGTLAIHTVQLGIETADAAGVNTTQPLVVKVWTQAAAGAPAAEASRTLQATQAVDLADQDGTILTVPLTTPTAPLPADAVVVVEVFTPDGQAAGHRFFIGSNAAGQTAPSYLQAPACGVNTPTNIASIGFPNMQIVLKAIGTLGGVKTLAQNLAAAVTAINALAPPTITGTAQQTILVNLVNLAARYAGTPYKSLGLSALDSALVRVDGCALRTVPDTVITQGGAGMDFVTTCPAQAPIYNVLKAARDQYVAP